MPAACRGPSIADVAANLIAAAMLMLLALAVWFLLRIKDRWLGGKQGAGVRRFRYTLALVVPEAGGERSRPAWKRRAHALRRRHPLLETHRRAASAPARVSGESLSRETHSGETCSETQTQ